MNLKYFSSLTIVLLLNMLLSGCDVIQQLQTVKTVAQVQRGVDKIEGDKSLPGAQKGGVILAKEGHKITNVKPDGRRYRDVIFTDIRKTTETYARGVVQHDGSKTDLVMDIYMPEGDNTAGRPCVIFVFGGGWFMKTVDGMDHISHQFAQRGYVGVSIDYRYGFHKATTIAMCKDEWSGLEEAVYRAAQDAKAAIRYVKANADRLGIDKNRIFIGGHSAGAFTSINAVQLDDGDVPASIREKLGPLNAVGEHQDESDDVMGNYVLAGGAISTMDYIDKDVPTYLMMGTCDELLPYGSGKLMHCTESAKHPIVYTGPELYGHYQKIGACVHLDVMCRGDHGNAGHGWKAVGAVVGDFVWKTMTGKCTTDKRGIEPKTPRCKEIDASVCKPAS